MTRAQIAVTSTLAYFFLYPRKYREPVKHLSTTIGVRFDNNQYVYAINHNTSQITWEKVDHQLDLDVEGTTTNRSKFRVVFKYRSSDTVTIEYRGRTYLEFKDRGDYLEVYDTNTRNEVYEMRVDSSRHIEVKTPYNSDYSGNRLDIELY